MFRLTDILAISIIITSCNNSTQEKTTETSEQVNVTEITRNDDSLLQADNETKTYKSDSQITINKSVDTVKNKKRDEGIVPSRYIEFPGDAHFNGKPMTQQEEIPKAILEKYPDTLSKLAIARYKRYDYFFPKSIADNFEDGISTEHIDYPKKLIFRFELFESESSRTPYMVKEVVVRRNPNGELFTE